MNCLPGFLSLSDLLWTSLHAVAHCCFSAASRFSQFFVHNFTRISPSLIAHIQGTFDDLDHAVREIDKEVML